MQPVERTGQFRAQITDYGLTESKDGAVGVTIKATLLEWFNLTTDNGDGTHGAWEAWEQYQMEADGVLWVVKKNGEINQLAVMSLVQNAGWNGNLEEITGHAWQPQRCQVAIDKNDYKGQSRYRIAFVNDYDRNPLGMGSVAPEKARELQARFGSQLRAMAGNSKRNGAPTNGAPQIPAPPPPARQPAPAGASGDEIPF